MSPYHAERLPPLNAVRAFEAAAESGSFVRAAEDLGVTHWAVGKQVRLLEDWLGFALFERHARGVSLTNEGAEFLTDVSAAFKRIKSGAARLRQPERPRRVSGTVRVNVLSSFALRWLIPRLPSFHEAFPEIDVQVSTTSRRLRHIGSASDVGVRVGLERAPGLTVEPLMPDRRLPVCRPDILSNRPLETPHDLRRHALLHSSTTRAAWGQWLAAAKASDLSPARNIEFDHVYLQLQAAVDGLGVALASLPLIEVELAAGRLVCPFSTPVWHEDDYVLLVRDDRSHNTAVMAFRDWIMAEAKLAPA